MIKKLALLALLSTLLSPCVTINLIFAENNEPAYKPGYTTELHEDLREVILRRKHIDLPSYDLRNNDLTKTIFDTFTLWPKAEYLPKGFNPEEVLDLGRDPGLGVRELNSRGITGKGVNIAIIDQPLLLDHIEYKDQVRSYVEIETAPAGPQMHGAAVASLLCGNTCGVAPEVNLYYWAEPSWKRDYKYRTSALDQIIQFNEGKKLEDKIRVVSISKGFSPDEPNLKQWKEKIQEAEMKGIYVVHCSDKMMGVCPPLYGDRDAIESYELCYFLSGYGFSGSGYLYAPNDNRTYASWLKNDAYTFGSQGGLSWDAPYIAGVVALGLQVKPDLTVEEIDKLLMKTGYPFNFGKIINPIGFIEYLEN